MVPQRTVDSDSVTLTLPGDALPTDATAALAQRLTSTLRDYLASGRRRTDLLRDMAGDIVELRSHFQTTSGQTDWSGRSRGYRDTIAAVYRDAGVPPELMDTVLSALRYHTGNEVRRRVHSDELEDAGIRSVAPLERVTANRKLAEARLAAMDDGKMTPIRRLKLAAGLLEMLHPEYFREVDDVDAQDVTDTCDEIVVQVKALRAALPKARRRRG